MFRQWWVLAGVGRSSLGIAAVAVAGSEAASFELISSPFRWLIVLEHSKEYNYACGDEYFATLHLQGNPITFPLLTISII